ncbi:hypothetical protein ACN38_g5333 [Penicillium nordicum]|uniref:Uncharacterized protein n=1 Tax=Penicillium nordicum TaxID=229535 RepID=A0A0M9WGA7_9EURO|nr:hypothetical protein ACN38_g5333 [Penicillium nordicum]
MSLLRIYDIVTILLIQLNPIKSYQIQLISILSTRGNSIEHHLSYLAEAYSESIHPIHFIHPNHPKGGLWVPSCVSTYMTGYSIISTSF